MCLFSLFPFAVFVVVILEAENILLLTDNSSVFSYVGKIIFSPPPPQVSSKADNLFLKDELLHNI